MNIPDFRAGSPLSIYTWFDQWFLRIAGVILVILLLFALCMASSLGLGEGGGDALKRRCYGWGRWKGQVLMSEDSWHRVITVDVIGHQMY